MRRPDNNPSPDRARTSPGRVLVVEGIPISVSHKRVRNVNFRIRDDGSVAMSVPQRVSYATAERLARERIDWIREHREAVLARQDTQPHLWGQGERVRVWGEEVPIELSPAAGPETARMEGGRLVLHVGESHADGSPDAVRVRARLVERFLTDELSRALRTALPACEARVGRQATRVTIRRMKTRWGSCTVSRGTIRLNTALAEHPRPCLEMVLTHELCHLVFANHGPAFRELLGRCYPGWEAVQRHLDEHPPRMYPEGQR